MVPVLDQLSQVGIVPVVVIDDEENAEPLAEALLAGGLATMEITFRTEAGEKALANIAKAHPGMLLGAGTVLTTDQAARALDIGAEYVVSPGLDRAVVDYCLQRGATVLPGVVTPTEVSSAIALGLSVTKFFPAEQSGGIGYLKAISAPFRQMKFVPTGGIDASNVVQYLKLPQVIACGGSWMVKSDLIAARRFDDIRRLAAEAVALRHSVK